MNIALIIGNGFDINLGLPTQYKYFYEYYLSLETNKDRLIRNDLENNLSNWADLEKQLGQISTQYAKVDSYVEDIDDISEELTRYMQAVDKLDLSSLQESSKIVYEDLCDFTKYLDLPLKTNVNTFIQNLSNKDEIHLHVITFNYTSVFERIFEYWDTLSIGKIKEYTLFHIHQKLDEKGILLGIDNAKQIANPDFQNNYTVKATLIKPFINESFQNGINQDCEKAISQADIIILFGTSIGETDQRWWNYIGDCMYGNKKRLIYCPFDGNHITNMSKILRQNYDFSDFILNRMISLDTNKRNDVFRKIIPLRENKMFNFCISEKRINFNFSKVMKSINTNN